MELAAQQPRQAAGSRSHGKNRLLEDGLQCGDRITAIGHALVDRTEYGIRRLELVGAMACMARLLELDRLQPLALPLDRALDRALTLQCRSDGVGSELQHTKLDTVRAQVGLEAPAEGQHPRVAALDQQRERAAHRHTQRLMSKAERIAASRGAPPEGGA
ncbi:hypothetical protein [Nannocystis pusilla]|uniref:hypothetical protein n=1 Tax=Nannocystis pusilla TaxID=889268 RepID=UPI003B7F22E7